VTDHPSGPLAPPPGGEGPETFPGDSRLLSRRPAPVALGFGVFATVVAAGAGVWFVRSLRPADGGGAADTTGQSSHERVGTPSPDSAAAPADSVVGAEDLPGFDTAGLTAKQRLWLYHKAHLEECSCGCGMNVAQCRVEDPTCPESPGRARELVEEARRQPAS
jgi:hypothetical protein